MGTHHPLRIFAGSANRPLAEAVTHILNTPLGRCTTTHSERQRDARDGG
jgi:hypothetical protein